MGISGAVTPSAAFGGTVSPAGSAPAPRWGASRTDGRGNGDRRRTVPTGHLRPHRGRQAPLLKKHKIERRTRAKHALGGKGVLVPGGHRLGPTEAAAETEAP